jgi:anti-sigma regulatory factor (Ser/Thr protein kinase)
VFHTHRAVTVIIIDSGNAVTPPDIPWTLPDQTSLTGRGLYLAHRLSDEVKLAVNHMGHGLSVRVTKRFEPPRLRAS